MLNRIERENMISNETMRLSGIARETARCFQNDDEVGFKRNYRKFMTAVNGFDDFRFDNLSPKDIVDVVISESRNGNYIAKNLADHFDTKDRIMAKLYCPLTDCENNDQGSCRAEKVRLQCCHSGDDDLFCEQFEERSDE